MALLSPIKYVAHYLIDDPLSQKSTLNFTYRAQYVGCDGGTRPMIRARVLGEDALVQRLAYSLFGLEHGERPFMLLTGYYDESGTHGDSKFTVIAGFISRAEIWKEAEREWQKTLDNFEVPYFHSKEFFHFQGPFKKWRENRKKAHYFWCQLLYTLQNRGVIGSKTVLNNDDYRIFYLLDGKFNKERLDTKYALCYRAILSNLKKLQYSNSFTDPFGPLAINFVLESGHKNAGDAVRVHRELQELSQSEPIIGTLSFDDKKKSCALQAADMLAYTLYSAECMSQDDDELRWISALEDELLKSRLRFYEHVINPDDLKTLRKNYLRKNKMEAFTGVRIDDDNDVYDASECLFEYVS